MSNQKIKKKLITFQAELRLESFQLRITCKFTLSLFAKFIEDDTELSFMTAASFAESTLNTYRYNFCDFTIVSNVDKVDAKIFSNFAIIFNTGNEFVWTEIKIPRIDLWKKHFYILFYHSSSSRVLNLLCAAVLQIFCDNGRAELKILKKISDESCASRFVCQTLEAWSNFHNLEILRLNDVEYQNDVIESKTVIHYVCLKCLLLVLLFCTGWRAGCFILVFFDHEVLCRMGVLSNQKIMQDLFSKHINTIKILRGNK